MRRDENVWRLTASATFCLEPAGDSPTRSHLYLAVLLGCVPVIFDGDAPDYHPTSSTSTMSTSPSTSTSTRTSTINTSTISSSSEEARSVSEATPWAWRRQQRPTTPHPSSGTPSSLPPPHLLDYESFAVRFDMAQLRNASFDLVQVLIDMPASEVRRLQRGVDRAARLMRYAPTSQAPPLWGQHQHQHQQKTEKKADEVEQGLLEGGSGGATAATASTTTNIRKGGVVRGSSRHGNNAGDYTAAEIRSNKIGATVAAGPGHGPGLAAEMTPSGLASGLGGQSEDADAFSQLFEVLRLARRLRR